MTNGTLKNGDSFKVAQLRLKLEKSHFLWFLPHFRHISTITRDAIQVFCQGFVELGRLLGLLQCNLYRFRMFIVMLYYLFLVMVLNLEQLISPLHPNELKLKPDLNCK